MDHYLWVVVAVAVVGWGLWAARIFADLTHKDSPFVEPKHPEPTTMPITVNCPICDDADIVELRKSAEFHVRSIEQEKQSGEWKFHQVYARMLKLYPNVTDRWKIGLAIQLALANIKTERK